MAATVDVTSVAAVEVVEKCIRRRGGSC